MALALTAEPSTIKNSIVSCWQAERWISIKIDSVPSASASVMALKIKLTELSPASIVTVSGMAK